MTQAKPSGRSRGSSVPRSATASIWATENPTACTYFGTESPIILTGGAHSLHALMHFIARAALTCVALVKGASEARCARNLYIPLQVNLSVSEPNGTFGSTGMRLHFCPSIVALTVACHTSAPHETADVTVLRAALADWQEGPTDGHVCLDARVLRNATSGVPVTYWAVPILDSLLADTLIAIDQSTLPPGHQALRRCLRSHQAPRVALGIPQARQDSVYIAMNAWVPSNSSDSSAFFESPVTLARQEHGWRVIAHPAQHFQILERAR